MLLIISRLIAKIGHIIANKQSRAVALPLYRAAHKLSSGSAYTSGYYGISLINSGSTSEGKRLIALSLKGQATSGRDFLPIAHCCAKIGEKDLACEAFERAIAISFDDPQILFEAAEYFLMIKKFDRVSALASQLLEIIPEDPRIRRFQMALEIQKDNDIKCLDFVLLGTMGLCNASCIHCPTGKLETTHVPRVPMQMELFYKIIDGLRDAEQPMIEGLLFGLFGDALVDPFVLERAKYVREQLPDVNLILNTNGAAYDSVKHAPLIQFVNTINLHCESLADETFNTLMSPLRSDRVKKKYRMMIKDFPEKILVSMPVSRLNFHEQESLQAQFMAMGAERFLFSTLSSRCAKDQSAFEKLAFDPQPIRCAPKAMRTLVIDCDGTVVACCNDFSREVPLGDAKNQSIQSILQDPRRLGMAKKFSENRHEEYSTCAKCRADIEIPESLEAVDTRERV